MGWDVHCLESIFPYSLFSEENMLGKLYMSGNAGGLDESIHFM